MKRRLNWKVLALIAAVIIVVIILVGRSRGDGGIKVEAAKAEKRTIIAKVQESGIIQPDLEVSVGPDVSGELVQILKKEGDYVKKGDLLFTIDPDNLQAAYDQALASYNSSRADYESAKASLAQQRANLKQDSINLVRNKQLRDQGAISAQDFENARLAFEVSKEQTLAQEQSVSAAYYRMRSSQASVRQNQENLVRTSVRASMDGVVTYMNSEVGDRVVGFGQMSGTEVMRIADLTRMEVKVEINENDIINLQLGDSADVEVDAYPGVTFKGVVTKIAYSSSSLATATATGGSTSDEVTTYPVEILIKPESYKNDEKLMRGLKSYQSPFRPGMSGLVNIYTDKAEDVWAVPIQAVTIAKTDGPSIAEARREAGPQGEAIDADLADEIVYIIGEDGTVKSASVKTGLADDEFIEIKSGVSDTSRVVTGPYTALTRLLKDGAKVEVREEGRGRRGGGNGGRGGQR